MLRDHLAAKVQDHEDARLAGRVLRMLGQKHRLTLFLLVGGLSSGIQFVLLWWFVHATRHELSAITLSVELSVLFNFTLNRTITWKDRFVGYTRWQSVRGFVPLFVLFNAVTPSIWIKIFGIPVISRILGIHPVLIAVPLEGLGVIVNYWLADKLFFGKFRRL